MEADVIDLEFRGGMKPDAAVLQSGGKLLAFVDHRVEIFAVQRAVIKFALQEHQPRRQRLFD